MPKSAISEGLGRGKADGKPAHIVVPSGTINKPVSKTSFDRLSQIMLSSQRDSRLCFVDGTMAKKRVSPKWKKIESSREGGKKIAFFGPTFLDI